MQHTILGTEPRFKYPSGGETFAHEDIFTTETGKGDHKKLLRAGHPGLDARERRIDQRGLTVIERFDIHRERRRRFALEERMVRQHHRAQIQPQRVEHGHRDTADKAVDAECSERRDENGNLPGQHAPSEMFGEGFPVVCQRERAQPVEHQPERPDDELCARKAHRQRKQRRSGRQQEPNEAKPGQPQAIARRLRQHAPRGKHGLRGGIAPIGEQRTAKAQCDEPHQTRQVAGQRPRSQQGERKTLTQQGGVLDAGCGVHANRDQWEPHHALPRGRGKSGRKEIFAP